jgi:glycosyltransferase involved in cell wall biosynthesis
MNVLIIPSWYPYPGNPLAGKFFMDQAKALAKHTEHNYYLLNFGQNEYQLTLKKPLQNLAKLRAFASSTRQEHQLSERLWEICIPHLSWSSHIAKGNLDRFLGNLGIQVDLIYALVSFPAGYLAMRLAAKLRVPYLIAEHSGPFPFPQFTRNGKLSTLIQDPILGAKGVIAVSTALQKQIFDSTGVEVQVIPNMVDTDFFVPALAKHSSPKLRLFSMSAFTLAKGVTDLLQALYALWQIDQGFEMVWAGAGPLHRSIIRQAARLPISFPGFLNPEQARQQYQNCDLYLMPSRIESFSLVLIEAMSSGVPSVATACGGPSDIISAKTGILCEAQNPQALLQAIMEYQVNRDCYDPHTIRALCIKRFSKKTICAQLNSCFEASLSC